MKFEKLNFTIALVSIIAIASFSYTIISEEASALRDPDRDYDGIVDYYDECPEIPENYNKFEDEDGCPDTVIEEKTKYEFPDTDGDGFDDRIDNCITLPETFNDYLDYDGCPERDVREPEDLLDSDSDSVPDSVDVCPHEQETINEYKDGDGCPDSLILGVSKISEKSIILDNQCLEGKIQVMRINSQEPLCVYSDTAQRWEELGIGEIIDHLSTPLDESENQMVISDSTPELENIIENAIPPTVTPYSPTIDEISSRIILDTDKTEIGQVFSYPTGQPKIISKIVTIPAGVETGPHMHEYPLYAYILEGEVTVDYGDEGVKKFVKGDSLIEAINFKHNGINTGVIPTQILVVLLSEK